MAASDRVKCVGCGREVVPQLMVDDRDRFYRPRIMHLCPFCGAILHESGGELDRGMLALVVGVCLFGLISFVLLLALR
jgi:ribosomal protein S27E